MQIRVIRIRENYVVAKGAETCELAITTVELLRIRQPDFIQKGEVFEKGDVADLVRSHMTGLPLFKRTNNRNNAPSPKTMTLLTNKRIKSLRELLHLCCLVPVRLSPGPSQSIDFGEVSESAHVTRKD